MSLGDTVFVTLGMLSAMLVVLAIMCLIASFFER